MSANPNPSRITDAMWRLWQKLHALEPGSALGGIYANKSGYHNTRDANDAHWPGTYSVRETADRRGPRDKAAALDWTFPNAQHGDYSTIRRYSARLLASGKDRNDHRLDGWREFYGNVNGDTHVDGWDFRHSRAVSSDRSHLWHIHLSETREFVSKWANKDALLSVLTAEPLAAWKARHPEGQHTVKHPPSHTGTLCKGKYRPALHLGDKGSHVLFLQKMIGARADGDFGGKTQARVRWYQHERGINVDGAVGPQTWKEIDQM